MAPTLPVSYRTLSVTVAVVAATALLAGCAERPVAPATKPAAKAAALRTALRTSMTPNALAVDGAGNLYIADAAHHVIDRLATDGSLTTIAGLPGTGGALVPGPALSSPLSNPSGLAVDGSGNVYVADTGNSEVVGVISSATKQLSVVAGVLGENGPLTPGPATASDLGAPSQLALDGAGNLYIADQIHFCVDKVDPSGNLSVVAGTPGNLGAPVAGPATDAALYAPTGVAVDGAGNLYIADSGNHVVEKVDSSGTLSILAGTPGSSGAPTPGPADESLLGVPSGLAVGSDGTVYIADPDNDIVEAVASDGTLSVVAGTPDTSGAPTAGPATSSALGMPGAVAVDGAGNLFIADTGDNLVERVSDGQLSIVAGTGTTTAMTKVQTLANNAVSSRLQSVQRLLPAVQAAQWLTPDDRTTALALLEADQGTLLDLGKQLADDTVTSQAYAHYRAVFVSLRIYALAVQQVYLAGASDDLLYGVIPAMTSARDQLRALLDGADSGLDTPQIEAQMSDLSARIAMITDKTTGLGSTVLAYTPDQRNANLQLLRPARQAVAAASNAAAKGRADIAALQEALGAALDPSDPAPISAASRAAGNDLAAANRAQSQNDQPAVIAGIGR